MVRFCDEFKALSVIAPNDSATAAVTARVDAVPVGAASVDFVIAFTTDAAITPKVTVNGYDGSAYKEIKAHTFAAKNAANTYVVSVECVPAYAKYQLKVEGSGAGTFAVAASAVWRVMYADGAINDAVRA